MTTHWGQDILQASDVTIRFGAGPAVVDGASFSLPKGRICALVGESGSGKSLLAHAIAGILTPDADLRAETLAFAGVDLVEQRGARWRDLRGRQIAIIFQNPRAALSPVRRIGQQIGDVISSQQGLRGKALKQAVIEALESVRIPDPEARARAYPGELSGGMCQRVMIAIALSCNPALLIADEPTTGLDVTTQAAVLDLVLEASRARRMSCLLITHDLALAREYADLTIAMHAGQIVESGPTESLFRSPRHPYTKALAAASASGARSIEDLGTVPGTFPALRETLPACRYADRCDRVQALCRTSKPALDPGAGQGVACWRPLS